MQHTPIRLVGQGAAAMATAMGVGRFVYTPILPLMHTQAGLSAQWGAALATANYIGYLVGALIAIFIPTLTSDRSVLRGSLVAVVATLALMPATHSDAIWFALRLITGVASALIFVIAVSALLTGLRGHAQHLIGWSFGGVGAGIALSGAFVLVIRTTGTWQEAWWIAAALSLVCTVPAWRLPTAAAHTEATGNTVGPRWFLALLTSYSLEGIGYIIAGTFLVAAIDQTAAGWVGSGAWVLVGLAALPSTVLWAWLSRTWSRPGLLATALAVQAIGIALPVLVGGVAAALVSAVLFGATFLGAASIVLAIGTHLRVPRAVAILTTGYSVGQILGPLAVTPLLHNGYHEALLIGAGVVALAAIAAAALRYRFPHHLGPLPSRLCNSMGRTPGQDAEPNRSGNRIADRQSSSAAGQQSKFAVRLPFCLEFGPDDGIHE
ncbi:MAG TPA: YbfB/YjiJ family MFS transporter [Pseudonocardiaceae bacterium]|nr:YbfB/YjiJ family MFS transporter [Pseudonocardiaceae bacterium]